MLKQLSASILSVSILSVSATSTMAQNISETSTNSNLIAENQSSISEYPTTYSTIPSAASDLDDLAVTNNLDFANIGQIVDAEDSDLISQRTRTRTTTRTRSRSGYKYSAGFDSLITFGWVKDENGSINSILGFNYLLGIGYKKYFTPAEAGQINFSYTLGTWALVAPIAALGLDYQWDFGLYVGGDAIVFPLSFFVDDFLFPVLPSLSVGYRW